MPGDSISTAAALISRSILQVPCPSTAACAAPVCSEHFFNLTCNIHVWRNGSHLLAMHAHSSTRGTALCHCSALSAMVAFVDPNGRIRTFWKLLITFMQLESWMLKLSIIYCSSAFHEHTLGIPNNSQLLLLINLLIPILGQSTYVLFSAIGMEDPALSMASLAKPIGLWVVCISTQHTHSTAS